MAKSPNDMVLVSQSELDRLRKIEEVAYAWVDDCTREASNELHAFLVSIRTAKTIKSGTNQHGVEYYITEFIGRDFTEFTVHWKHKSGSKCSRWYVNRELAFAFAYGVGFYST